MRIEPLFAIQGREVPAHPYSNQVEDEIIDNLTMAVQAEYRQLMQQKIDPLECPVHHQHAQLTLTNVTYTSSAEIFEGDYQIEACCPEFRAAVLKALKLQ